MLALTDQLRSAPKYSYYKAITCIIHLGNNFNGSTATNVSLHKTPEYTNRQTDMKDTHIVEAVNVHVTEHIDDVPRAEGQFSLDKQCIKLMRCTSISSCICPSNHVTSMSALGELSRGS